MDIKDKRKALGRGLDSLLPSRDLSARQSAAAPAPAQLKRQIQGLSAPRKSLSS